MEKEKKNPSKAKILWTFIGITLFGIFSVTVLFTSTNPILANPDTKVKKSTKQMTSTKSDAITTKSAKAKEAKAYLAKALDPIENEAGLKATPKVLTLKQNEAFPDLTKESGRKKLFSEIIIPKPEKGAIYEYVTAEGITTNPASEVVGFQTIYVKITENDAGTTISVPIPVTVTDIGTSLLLDNQIAIQIDHVDSKVILYPNETANKTAGQLQELVKTKSNARSWKTEDGESVPVDVVKTDIKATSVGIYEATFQVVVKVGDEEKTASTRIKVVVFGANPTDRVLINQNAKLNLDLALFKDKKLQSVNNTGWSSAISNFVDENGEVLDKFDTSIVGFRWAYVKITDKNNKDVSTTIKVPINVKDENTRPLLYDKVILKADMKVLLYPYETKGKTDDELHELVYSKSHVSAWDTSTGEAISTVSLKTNIKNNSVGTYTSEFTIEYDGKTESVKDRKVIVFGANVKKPYYFKVEQYKEMKLDQYGENYFSKWQTVKDIYASDATFEWVKNLSGEPTEPPGQFDTSKTGFHMGYIKMADKNDKSVSLTIPIPITVTEKDSTVIVGDEKGDNDGRGVGLGTEFLPYLNVGDINDKNDKQINQLLTEKLAPKVWDPTSGEELANKVKITSVLSSGRIKVTFIIQLRNGETTELERMIPLYPDKLFGKEGFDNWEKISYGVPFEKGVVMNPINNSFIGFRDVGVPGRVNPQAFYYGGIESRYRDGGLAYTLRVNKDYNISYLYDNGMGSELSMVNVDGTFTKNSISDFSDTDFVYTKFYRRRDGRAIKGVGLPNDKSETLYVYDLSLAPNLSFDVSQKVFNISKTTKKIGIINAGRFSNITSDHYAYPLPNGAGFTKKINKGKIPKGGDFIVRFKDFQGNLLNGTTQWYLGLQKSYSKTYFGEDISKPGLESKILPEDKPILGQTDNGVGYIYGSSVKSIEPNDAAKAGYNGQFGEPLPLMDLEADPNEFHVYEDTSVSQFETKYKLSKIPNVGDHGTVHIIYPNKEEKTEPFRADENKEFKSGLSIQRKQMPVQLNDEPGTIKEYSTSILAINETEGLMLGLPSNDFVVSVLAYNLGAKPIPQIIKKGTAFNKKASEVIQDAVILPGHTASYEYEGDMPDTSVAGLTSVMVRMRDTDEPGKTTLIKVPIVVTDNKPPTNGLYLLANDFYSPPEEFQNLTESEARKLILKKSEAVAWDIATGSSEDVELSVTSTTLPLNPEKGSYTAKVQAVRGKDTKEKEIKIDIQRNQKVNVEFVDEAGDTLHDKITFDRVIGTTIDLTEETEVQQALESILAKNYQLVKKPDNETKIPVTSEESTVQYQFKGMLFVQSSPNFLNFGRKSLGLPIIKVEKAKYDKPLIVWDNRKNGGAWELTATLKKPLTSQENPSKVLPSVIRYKVSDTETVVLSENVTQSVAERTHKTKGEYNVSNEWDKNETGLLLEVPSGEVLQAGGYRATILWQVEQTP